MSGFVRDHIIKVYLWSSFDEIPEEELLPIITEIKIGCEDDECILNTWEEHFQGLYFGVKLAKRFQKPYVVTLSPKTKTKTLWVKGPRKGGTVW